ncbi:MAG: hypothetical protein JSW69_00655 [Deltaproteobacteria bacterium]|nr:MAG: hypothetical protein JSW69_00655 [Deltaproteobacteria bacterium]
MFKDYSGSFIMVNGRNKIKPSKKKSTTSSKELFPTTKLMWKTIGAMLLVTLVIGISSTVWYGLQVQVALDQIGRNKAINNQLHNQNKLLIAQQDLMLSQEHMEEVAQKLGLSSPAKKQLRYP